MPNSAYNLLRERGSDGASKMIQKQLCRPDILSLISKTHAWKKRLPHGGRAPEDYSLTAAQADPHMHIHTQVYMYICIHIYTQIYTYTSIKNNLKEKIVFTCNFVKVPLSPLTMKRCYNSSS